MQRVKVKNIIGPMAGGTAVLLGNEEKTFIMFVGLFEGAAMLREIHNEPPPRPLTHDLLDYVLTGFDVAIKQVIISKIVDSTFCATLILEQKVMDEQEAWTGKRNEVRIDARPSDCIVLALKHDLEIDVADEVFREVNDVSDEMGELQQAMSSGQTAGFDPSQFPDFKLNLPGDSGTPGGGESSDPGAARPDDSEEDEEKKS